MVLINPACHNKPSINAGGAQLSSIPFACNTASALFPASTAHPGGLQAETPQVPRAPITMPASQHFLPLTLVGGHVGHVNSQGLYQILLIYLAFMAPKRAGFQGEGQDVPHAWATAKALVTQVALAYPQTQPPDISSHIYFTFLLKSHLLLPDLPWEFTAALSTDTPEWKYQEALARWMSK